MGSIDWTWLLVGIALGMWGIPLVLGMFNSRRKAAANAS